MRPSPLRRRLPDWPERLAALIEDRRNTPFAWGPQDCCSFAADVALAVTDADPIAVHRGAYHDEDGALALVGPEGLEAFVAALMRDFGAPEIPPELAQRGDWVFAAVGNDLLSGVALGEVVAVPGPDRLAFVPMSRVRRAWAI